MDNDAPTKRRDRLMGKFFGKERSEQKARDRAYTSEQTANDISAFLGGPGDRLQVSHPPPPPPAYGHREYDKQQPTLALDTTKATRYPAALDVDGTQRSSSHRSHRSRSHSPPRLRKNKGLVVRFVDSYPEIIGEGGDECPTAVAEIGRRKRSKSAPAPAMMASNKRSHEYARPPESRPKPEEAGFMPPPMRRTQTSDPAPVLEKKLLSQPRAVPAGEPIRSPFLDTSDRTDSNRRSFIEVTQQEQRRAEGMALAEAMRSASQNSQHEWEDQEPASSPEQVRPEPRRPQPPAHRQQLPPQVNVSDATPLAHRSQSTRVPSSQRPGPSVSPLPLRSKSTRQPQMPSQPPPPPRNPSRGSPLPGASSESLGQYNASKPTYPTQSLSTSPLPPPAYDDASSFYGNDPMASQGAMTPEKDLHIKTNSLDGSPSSVYSGSGRSNSDQSYRTTPVMQTPTARAFGAHSPEKSSRKLHDVVVSAGVTAGEDAYDEYIQRTSHLYELFRLHAEQYKPLSACQPSDFCRAAVWWFLKGRMALESTIRTQSADPNDQKLLINRYQAYTDLTKAYWLAEKALPEFAEGKFSPVDGEHGEVRHILRTNLMKLAGSMKRNGFLPPEEPFMPQVMDKSIWVEYPQLSQDLISLLNGNWGSLLASSANSTRTLSALEALPIGDSPSSFTYGRVPAEGYLMEQGMESTRTYLRCMLTITRPTDEANLVFVLASQNGMVSLKIQSDKQAGATWESVRWRNESNTLEVKMPRGFLLAIQCSPQDFRMLWNIYDFNNKMQAYLYARKDEEVTFRSKLTGFHYFDADPKSRSFPKEPVGQCEVGVFERILKEGSPTGPRTFHRGFRVAIVTGPRTRTLSGVSHFYPPQLPIQFAYLRGDKREPMLQLAWSDAKDRCKMVLSFGDEEERDKFIALLKGSYVHHDEEIVAEVALQGFSMSEGLNDTRGGFPVLQKLPWQFARIINDRYAGDTPPTVLAEKLRLELNSIDGKGIPISTITDRVNMAPGEFKIRLGAKDILTLQVYRHPQVDMTVAIMDKPELLEAGRAFSALQKSASRSTTVRTYRFTSFKDLHAFQEGLTGYKVLYDGVASSLNISRRRMVVPVYKKWESGAARVQIVQQDKTVQLLAFFEDWSHGQCMGFVLKGTDVFESATGRGGKAVLKLVDAKFPLPRIPDEGAPKTDDMAFVNLDMPDYAGEHDDITILFDDEGERDRLCKCLPAPVKGSRLSKHGSK